MPIKGEQEKNEKREIQLGPPTLYSYDFKRL